MWDKSDFIPSCVRWAEAWEASPGPGDLWAQSYCAQVNLREGKNLFTQLVGWEVINFTTALEICWGVLSEDPLQEVCGLGENLGVPWGRICCSF